MFDFLGVFLIIVVIVGGILGYKKGFFESITKPLKIIASICLTVIVAAPILNVWTRPLFTEKTQGWISEALLENSQLSGEMVIDDLPLVFRLMIEILNVDTSNLDANATTEELINEISSKLAGPVGNFFAVIVTYAAVFLVLSIVLSIVISLLDIAFKKGTLGKINRVLGAVLGVVIAIVAACVLANIAYKILPSVSDGVITQFFKNINPFAIILQL